MKLMKALQIINPTKPILFLTAVCVFTTFLTAQNTLSIEVANGSIDILYNSDSDIGGFQFTVEGATVNGGSGGDAATNGFMISCSSTMCLGFSLTGDVIPAGTGTLVIISAEITGDVSLTGIVVSDAAGLALPFEYIDDSGGSDVEGCMQKDACNYNVDATVDDGSCEYATENYDCDGNCTAETDCAGACGGIAVIDECGVCGGDGSSCPSSVIDILYSTSTDIGGFQFTVDGVTVLAASGGAATDAGFSMSTGNNTVLGFSFTGATMPAGNGILVEVEVLGDPTAACLSGVILADPIGGAIDNEVTDCLTILQLGLILGCTDETACNYNAEADEDNGTCSYAEDNYDCDGNCLALEDCAGECGGSAAIDACGVCGGGGIPAGECDCAGNVDLGCGCGADGPSGCDNACGSTAELDECGVCGGDGIPAGACDCAGNTEDCAGVCGGSAENCPDWEDNPSAYEFTAVMNALVVVDGMPIAEAGDELAAFDSDGNCRGTGIQITPGFGPYTGQILYEIMLRSNAAGDVLSFQYYDASEDEVLGSGASYTFVINDQAGTLVDPHELSVGTVTLSIDLAAGWSFFSVNALVEDMGPNVVLGSLAPTSGDQIKNLGASATYYGEWGWQGSLSAIDATSMYMINLSSSDILDFSGTPADPTIPITLSAGWNWIGYLPQATLETNDALGTVVGTSGDQIKSQTASSTYYGEWGWQGSLSSMSSGQGFMLSVAEGSDLVYPASGMARISNSLEEPTVLPSSISSWDVNPHAYEFTGTIDMSIDSRDDFDGDYIGVFVGDKCRGIAKRMYFPIDGSYYYSAMVYSNVTEGEKLTFKYYSSLDDEITNYGESVEFTANMIVGNGLNTFSLINEAGTFGQPISYGLSDAYPNPFNPVTSFEFTLEVDGIVQVSVYDINGRQVAELINGYYTAGSYPAMWNANDLSSGVYMVHMTSGEYSTMQKVMLIK